MELPLFHRDAYLRDFIAKPLVQARSDESWTVVLDQTAFYPEGGGQPSDFGTLAGQPVLGVRWAGNSVEHILAGPLPDGPVTGEIDWTRRFDHMRQHTGQHLLSAICADHFGLATVSFHLGAEICTIDLKGEPPDSATLVRIEDQVNAAIAENRQVTSVFPTTEELTAMRLRKTLAIDTDQEQARIVIIDGLDWSGCGGTHVRATGELGLLKITRVERVKGGLTRMSYLAGERALRDYRAKHDLCVEVGRAFSRGPLDVADAVEKLRADEKAAKREAKELRERLAPHEAAALLASAETIGETRLVVVHEPDRVIDDLTGLAVRLIAQPGVVVLLTAGTSPVGVALRRSADLALHAGETLRALIAGMEAKGGGQADSARGGGNLLPEDVNRIAQRLRTTLSKESR